jgi:hypothetical protein
MLYLICVFCFNHRSWIGFLQPCNREYDRRQDWAIMSFPATALLLCLVRHHSGSIRCHHIRRRLVLGHRSSFVFVSSGSVVLSSFGNLSQPLVLFFDHAFASSWCEIANTTHLCLWLCFISLGCDFLFNLVPTWALPLTIQKTSWPPKVTSPKLSFRVKLLGPSQNIPLREKEDMIEKKLVRIELEDDNRLLPKVYIVPKLSNICAHLGRMLLSSNYWERTSTTTPWKSVFKKYESYKVVLKSWTMIMISTW